MDLIYFSISWWESVFAFCSFKKSVVFSPFISHFFAFSNENMKQKRAFLSFVDNITRAIFNLGFCK